MNTERWQRARALFQSTLEQPDERRAAYLSDACQGDTTLQREVESLIAAHAAAAGFLERPACRLTPDTAAVPALRPGDHIGSFEVLDTLGSGGMGEVYQALDEKLGRKVAIKVLPRAVAADAQRLARFERESRVLASLNHPHIAAIHSVEQVDDVRLLVLELVEGPTLADRLRAGPVPPDEALVLARNLAGALEAAHDRGIVHRDLKPANIKLPSSTEIKLLDFGLAKELAGHDPARAGTPVADGTADGLIVGTCAYMSPEQARGQPVDKRTDIWAFGCVLFEMLAGRRAFGGDTPSDTLAAVLDREPDWSCLPAATAPGTRRLLRRCLEKDPNHRLHDIADARIEIEDALSNQDGAPAITMPRAEVRTRATLLVLCAGAIGLGWWLHSMARSDQSPSHTTRFTWALPDDLGLDSPPVVSPDGQLIAFSAGLRGGGPSTLYVRPLDQLEARPVAGTDGAKQPFWSPDGRFLAYFARGKLMKVAVDGGAPTEICAAPDARGGAWSPHGVIVFTPLPLDAELMQVSDNGGTVEPVSLLDNDHGENSHRWPAFLPDGVHFLYFVRALSEQRRGVYLGRIDSPASTPGTPLFRSESEALYAPLEGPDRGVLLTAAGGRIEARPFDPSRQRVTGDPRTIDLAAAGNTAHHPMMLSASADVIVHAGSSLPTGQRMASIGRNGEHPVYADERARQGSPRVSPDGRRMAVARLDPTPGTADVWVEDLVRGTRVRVTRNVVAGGWPVWSPDGERLAFLAGSPQAGVLTIAAADGVGAVSTVQCPGRRCEPTDWSHDGRWLLATVQGERGPDVWMLPIEGDAKARPLLVQPYVERDARFSPDGRLVAYVSEETGRPEVSVQTIDMPPRREVISVAGGSQPVWSRDGRELFFVDPQGRLRSAPVLTRIGGRFHAGPSVLLGVPPIGSGHMGTQYDVSPDGHRIYFLDQRVEPPPSEFGVVVGWRRILK